MNCEVLKTRLVTPGVVVIKTEVRSTDRHTDEAHTCTFLARESLLKEGCSVLRSHLEKVVGSSCCNCKTETIYRLSSERCLVISNLIRRHAAWLTEVESSSLELHLAVSCSDVCHYILSHELRFFNWSVSVVFILAVIRLVCSAVAGTQTNEDSGKKYL